MAEETIVQVLMRRDNMSKADAEEAVEDARRAVLEGEDPEEVLESYFGLELDYIFEII